MVKNAESFGSQQGCLQPTLWFVSRWGRGLSWGRELQSTGPTGNIWWDIHTIGGSAARRKNLSVTLPAEFCSLIDYLVLNRALELDCWRSTSSGAYCEHMNQYFADQRWKVRIRGWLLNGTRLSLEEASSELMACRSIVNWLMVHSGNSAYEVSTGLTVCTPKSILQEYHAGLN